MADAPRSPDTHRQTLTTRVRTDDGLELHVETDPGPAGAPTVVFVHGFTAHLGEFDLQRQALRGRASLVLYDQRGHGQSYHRTSGRRQPPVERATIAQLGRDLAAVLAQATPLGPVVLVGHSMGGMTVLALARQLPALFGPRVAGAFLLATSAGGLVEKGVRGAVVRTARRLRVLEPLLAWLRLWAPLMERFYRRGTRLGHAYYRRNLFGTDDATPELVTRVQDMLEGTPVPVVAAFYPTLLDHDEAASLEVLARVPVTILVGAADRLTPVGHSRRMAAALPDAELVVVPGAGHSVNISRPEIVDAALLRLLDRVAEQAAA